MKRFVLFAILVLGLAALTAATAVAAEPERAEAVRVPCSDVPTVRSLGIRDGVIMYTNYPGRNPQLNFLWDSPDWIIAFEPIPVLGVNRALQIQYANCTPKLGDGSGGGGGGGDIVIPDIDHAFSCFGLPNVGNPGVWAVPDPNVFPTPGTFATGYWAPYAQKITPTATKIGDYYLSCYIPSGMQATGRYIGADGGVVPASAPVPGLYVEVA